MKICRSMSYHKPQLARTFSFSFFPKCFYSPLPQISDNPYDCKPQLARRLFVIHLPNNRLSQLFHKLTQIEESLVLRMFWKMLKLLSSSSYNGKEIKCWSSFRIKNQTGTVSFWIVAPVKSLLMVPLSTCYHRLETNQI